MKHEMEKPHTNQDGLLPKTIIELLIKKHELFNVVFSL